MPSPEYLAYLRSDHWRQLRKAKLASSVKPVCGVCPADVGLDLHHLCYRKLYDVTVDDLWWLCRACHEMVHGLLRSGALVYRSPDPVARRLATLAAIRRRRRREQMQRDKDLVLSIECRKCGRPLERRIVRGQWRTLTPWGKRHRCGSDS